MIFTDNGPVLEMDRWDAMLVIDGLPRCIQCQRPLMGQETLYCEVCMGAYRTLQSDMDDVAFHVVYGMERECLDDPLVREAFDLPAEGAD